MKKIVVLVSGGGTNLQSLIDDGVKISLVIANKTGIFALERAKNAEIPTMVIERNAGFQDNLLKTLENYEPDLVVLAGFLTVLSDAICTKFVGKIINIHPALLTVHNSNGKPKYGGVGMYGLNVHKAIIKNGEKITGATVHFVSAEVDEGEIIVEKSVEVPDNVTPNELQKIVMEKCETYAIVEAVRKFL